MQFSHESSSIYCLVISDQQKKKWRDVSFNYFEAFWIWNDANAEATLVQLQSCLKFQMLHNKSSSFCSHQRSTAMTIPLQHPLFSYHKLWKEVARKTIFKLIHTRRWLSKRPGLCILLTHCIGESCSWNLATRNRRSSSIGNRWKTCSSCFNILYNAKRQ